MTKEYLKMTDVFELPVNEEDRESAVDLFSHILATPYSVDYTITLSKYVAHAINSHDELVAEVDRLRNLVNELERENENISAILLERTSALGPYI